MKKSLLFSLLSVLTCLLHGQDYTITQYMQLPATLNPALTGNVCGIRLTSFYQNSSSKVLAQSVYQNFGMNIDAPIIMGNKTKLGLGYQFIRDVAGESKFGSANHFIAVSISKSLQAGNTEHHLSMGASGGFSSRSLGGSDLRWPSQITPNGFNPNIPPGESGFETNIRYVDMNVGLGWDIILQRGHKIATGIVAYHINQPNISFLGTSTSLQTRLAAYISTELIVSNKWAFLPSAFYTKQDQFDTYNVALGGKYTLYNKNWIQLSSGYIKHGQPFVGVALGIGSLTLLGNYNFENDASLKRAEVGIKYIFKTKNCI